MKKNNPIRDCVNLSYIEFLKFKNHLKITMTHPFTAIKTVWSYLFLILMFTLPLFNGRNSKKRTIVDISVKDNFTLNIISLIVTMIILIVFFYSIYSAANKYRPSQFSVSDANYLFSSPIEPRTIYLWTMIRSIISGIRTILFFIVIYLLYGVRYYKINLSNFVYVAFGLLFLTLFLKSLSFFIYSVCMKFKVGRVIKGFVYVCMIVSGAYVVGSIIYKHNIVKGLFWSLNGNIISSVPVIGWTRDVLISPFFSGYNPIYKVIALFIIALVFFSLAVYFAEDYYEEAVETIEVIEKNKETIKSIDNDEIINDIDGEKDRKAKAVKDKFQFKGAWAFIWKANIVNQRTSTNVIRYISWGLAFGISMFAAYLGRNTSSSKILEGYLTTALVMVTSGGMSVTSLKYERTKQYLFIVPGNAWEKIVSLHFFEFIGNFIFDFCIVLPIVIMNRRVSLFGSLFLLFALWGTYIITVFNKFLINLIMPSFDDEKNGFLMTVFDILAFAPAGIVAGVIGYFVFHSLVWGLVIYFFGLLGTGALYCLFMDKLFASVEMK
ncbi:MULTISPECIES: putative ABC exporter domain-containing protein [Clostridium]|uniref:putative ABC exporter domain-containing protein n=1 Tax=Clostridium TaxID=1485 RepID=UPI000824B5AF|nr:MULTISPECIES: putative ABC exporter domain-containing protein [Clostridium]PJI08539.1 hypothetical protein CUB90_12020 [Clostridium sp. CT7]